MLVILEGPDGAGKTTLAHKIVGQLAHLPDHVTVYQHQGPPEGDPFVEYSERLADYEPDGGISWVLDRWHFGEMVYGPLYRGGSGLSTTAFQELERFLDDRGAVVVLCNGRVTRLAKRLCTRGEKPDRLALSREAQLFDIVAKTSDLPVIKSPVGVEVSAEEVIDIAREREEEKAS